MTRRPRTPPPAPTRRTRRPAPEPVPEPGPTPAVQRALLAALIVAYAVTFSILCAIRWRYYLYTDFDLSIFAQSIDGILRGTLFTSIRGMPWLGDHSSLILFVLAPLYAIARHPVTLLVVQSVALALGALPIHALARRELRHDGLALVCAALYLLQPAMGYANLFEFHPEMIATPLLAAAFLFVRTGSTRAALVAAGLALLCREDVALVVAMLGLYALVGPRPRQPRIAVGLLLSAALSLAVTFLVLRPLFTHGETEYAGVYRQWGTSLGSVVSGILSRPDLALMSLVTTPGVPLDSAIKHQYHLTLFLPFAFLPFLSPVTLLIALPAFAEHLLSWRGAQHTILCQYTALILPFLAVATVMGMKNLLGWTTPRGSPSAAPRPDAAIAVGAIALAASLFCGFLYGPLFSNGKFLITPTRGRNLPTGAEVTAAHARDRLLRTLPSRGGVVASFELLPHLTRRDSVHSLHHVMTGEYTFSKRPYPTPSGVATLIADLGSNNVVSLVGPGVTERLIRVLATNRLVPVGEEGDLVRFDQGARDTLALVGEGTCRSDRADSILFDQQLRFLGSERIDSLGTAGGSIRIATCWRRITTSDRFHGMELTLVSADGRTRRAHRRDIGYLYAPPLSWPVGVATRENYRLLLDDDMPAGVYRLWMKVVWRGINISGDSQSDASPDRYRRDLGTALGQVTITRAGRR